MSKIYMKPVFDVSVAQYEAGFEDAPEATSKVIPQNQEFIKYVSSYGLKLQIGYSKVIHNLTLFSN